MRMVCPSGDSPEKSLLLASSADHHHSRALELILFAETSPRTDRKTTDAVIDGIHAGKEQIGEGARVMLNGHVLLVEDGVTPFTMGTSLRT